MSGIAGPCPQRLTPIFARRIAGYTRNGSVTSAKLFPRAAQLDVVFLMSPEETALTTEVDPAELLEAIWRLRRDVVDANGQLRLLPTSFYEQSPAKLVALWGVILGVFVFPTIELVEWLQKRVIRGRRAIEVGAGVGALGRFLGIPTTDSYHIVEDPGVARRFAEAGHFIPCLDPMVTERLDAASAMQKYQPEVVIAGWSIGRESGQPWSVDERAIVSAADYCLFGHVIAHTGKVVRRLPHKELELRWLVSRAMARRGNRVWLFPRHSAAETSQEELPHAS